MRVALEACVVLLKLFPKQFTTVEETLRRAPLKNAVIGLLLIIVSAIVIILLMITGIGVPMALVLGMLFAIALITSGLFVALALGRKIGSALNLKIGDIGLFIIGFIVLSLLYIIPIVGFFIMIVTVCLGFGAIFYAIRDNWSSLRTSP